MKRSSARVALIASEIELGGLIDLWFISEQVNNLNNIKVIDNIKQVNNLSNIKAIDLRFVGLEMETFYRAIVILIVTS